MIHADNTGSAEQIVRAALAAADRRRRWREASRHIWRVAPALAAVGLGFAAIGRWAGWPASVPIAVLLTGAAALFAYAFVNRRAHPITDAAAARIDGDAGMHGELRSASWFARRTTRDAWADFHLAAAAERLQTIDWIRLYPAIRAPRAQIATAVLTIAALALAAMMPPRDAVQASASVKTVTPSAVTERAAGEVLVLDPELQKLLEELLASAANGTLPAADALTTNTEMRELLSKLTQLTDLELLEALKRALAANPDLQAKAAAEQLKALADQAKRSAEAGTMSADLQKALEKLSDEIEIANAQNETQDPSQAASGGPQEGQMNQAGGAAGMDDLSIQFAKEPDAGGGAGVLMMPGQGAPQGGGPPGSGVGGGSGSTEAAASAAMLEAALKQELVEASQDNAGENVETDIRRKTKHGNATVAFTGGAARTFERGRAAAAPPMPEARRTGVQTYFVRKPQ